MTYTALESHGYYNIQVIKYFCTTTNLSLTHVLMYSDLSNTGLFSATLRDQFWLVRNTAPGWLFQILKTLLLIRLIN